MSDELLELADRCEAASGPDKWLDACIRCVQPLPEWAAIAHRGRKLVVTQGGSGFPVVSIGKNGPSIDVPAYTASLDAAMTLVPEGYGFMLDGSGADWYADLDAAHDMQSSAKSPALALTAAALRTRASHLRMEVE